MVPVAFQEPVGQEEDGVQVGLPALVELPEIADALQKVSLGTVGRSCRKRVLCASSFPKFGIFATRTP